MPPDHRLRVQTLLSTTAQAHGTAGSTRWYGMIAFASPAQHAARWPPVRLPPGIAGRTWASEAQLDAAAAVDGYALGDAATSTESRMAALARKVDAVRTAHTAQAPFGASCALIALSMAPAGAGTNSSCTMVGWRTRGRCSGIWPIWRPVWRRRRPRRRRGARPQTQRRASWMSAPRRCGCRSRARSACAWPKRGQSSYEVRAHARLAFGSSLLPHPPRRVPLGAVCQQRHGRPNRDGVVAAVDRLGPGDALRGPPALAQPRVGRTAQP